MDVKDELKLRQWAQDMQDQKSSGLPQKQWCDMHGIKPTTFEYRCRKVREAVEKERCSETNEIIFTNPAVPEPAFAKVTLTAPPKISSGIDIQFFDTKIHISPDADPEHIRIVMEALSHAQRS